jgi:pimeloyl-ACP methyl ester carboxylesterase
MTPVLSILCILFTASFLATWAGFALAIADRGERLKLDADALSLFFREWTETSLLWLVHPLGLREPSAADFVAGGIERPVLLVPDRGGNRIGLWPMQAYLQSRGFAWTARLNLGGRRTPIPELAQRLSDRIDQICQQTHEEQVDLVGHGAGGVACAWMLANLPRPERVRSLISIASPWSGTATWVFQNTPDLAPTSAVIEALDPTRCPVTTLWSRTSPRVIPCRSAAPDGTDAIEVTQIGHVDFLFSGRTFELVANALRNPPTAPKRDG